MAEYLDTPERQAEYVSAALETGNPEFGTMPGVLQEGNKADIVLFDPATIIDTGTFDDPHRTPKGIAAVWVNGKLAAHCGKATGERGGRVLRRE